MPNLETAILKFFPAHVLGHVQGGSHSNRKPSFRFPVKDISQQVRTISPEFFLPSLAAKSPCNPLNRKIPINQENRNAVKYCLEKKVKMSVAELGPTST